jgi:hypothetical protein
LRWVVEFEPPTSPTQGAGKLFFDELAAAAHRIDVVGEGTLFWVYLSIEESTRVGEIRIANEVKFTREIRFSRIILFIAK